MADQRYRGPLDLMLVYLTPSHHGVGQRLKLETIENRLAKLPLRQVLRLLAITAHRADRSLTDRDERIALVGALVRRGPAQARAAHLVETGPYAVTSSQQALLLAQRALVHCPDTVSTLSDDELGYRVGELLMALGDHMGSRAGTGDELVLEMVRLSVFHRVHGVLDWYTAAHGVFFDTLPLMEDDPDYVDVDGLLRTELDISLADYWMVSAAIGMLGADRQLHLYPKQVGVLAAEISERFFATQTQTIADARVLAEREVKIGSPWALGTFFLRPILVDVAPDGGYPMRSMFLALKATLIGMHYLVRDLLAKQGPAASLAWGRLFGRAVQRYGRSLIVDRVLVGLSFPDEERTPAPNLPPACDFYIEALGGVVAGDFVHRALTLATQTTGSTKDLDRDLLLGVVEKAEQVDATLVAKCPDASAIYPVVVMSGPLPMNPTLAGRIEKLLRSRNKTTWLGKDPRCRPVAVLELHELRLLLLTAAGNDLSVAEVLDRWSSSAFGSNSFRDWLVTQRALDVHRAAAEEPWEQAMRRQLFGDAGASATG